MNTDDNQRQITRREFDATVGTIYLLIGLVAINTIRVDDSLGNLLRSIPAYVVGFGALIVGLVYEIKALAARPSRNAKQNK